MPPRYTIYDYVRYDNIALFRQLLSRQLGVKFDYLFLEIFRNDSRRIGYYMIKKFGPEYEYWRPHLETNARKYADFAIIRRMKKYEKLVEMTK
jgi:hypothetical protein